MKITIKQLYLAMRKRVLSLVRGRFFVVRRDGHFFLIDILNFIDRQIEAYGGYEQSQIEQFLEKISRHQASVFIDIGANLGLYSISVAKKFPECQILAFEPDRRNFSQLHANLFLNKLQNRVDAKPIAISQTAGFANFCQHNDENRGRSHISIDGGYEVQTCSLDAMIPEKGARIAIKIDVEGHEESVIAGATGVLTNNNCIIQIESFNPETIERKLESLEYRVTERIGDDMLFEKVSSLGRNRI